MRNNVFEITDLGFPAGLFGAFDYQQCYVVSGGRIRAEFQNRCDNQRSDFPGGFVFMRAYQVEKTFFAVHLAGTIECLPDAVGTDDNDISGAQSDRFGLAELCIVHNTEGYAGIFHLGELAGFGVVPDSRVMAGGRPR